MVPTTVPCRRALNHSVMRSLARSLFSRLRPPTTSTERPLLAQLTASISFDGSAGRLASFRVLRRCEQVHLCSYEAILVCYSRGVRVPLAHQETAGKAVQVDRNTA